MFLGETPHLLSRSAIAPARTAAARCQSSPQDPAGIDSSLIYVLAEADPMGRVQHDDLATGIWTIYWSAFLNSLV